MNVGVIGGSQCSWKNYECARSLGRLVASCGWTLICGGGTGVMEAACRGVVEAGGISVGILPGTKMQEANDYVRVVIPTGLGYARNIFVVRASQVLVAFAGKYGTLSEISFALNEQKPVIGIGTWDIRGIIKAKSPRDAIARIKKSVDGKKHL